MANLNLLNTSAATDSAWSSAVPNSIRTTAQDAQAKLTAQQEFDLKKAQKRAEEEARTAADANYPSPQGDSAEAFREEPRLDASVTFLVREALDELRLDDDASEDQEHAQHDAGEMLTGALEAGEAEEDPAWLQDATLHLVDRLAWVMPSL
jgi:hypothetical protein